MKKLIAKVYNSLRFAGVILLLTTQTGRMNAQVLPEDTITSYLEVYDIETLHRTVVFKAKSHFEAPNWTRDGNFLLFNCHGKLYKKIVFGCDEPNLIQTGSADRCNNDHGFSPDGKFIAISHSPEMNSLIYIVPAEGGEPRQVTKDGPSYWHGWSPDGKTLAYCAARNGKFDIYTIPVEGGEEIRLTDAEGLDDGPDYSPDGKWIYFNSERTGKMKIWRMHPDGSGQEQVTFDEFNDWFAHPSPDSKWILFVSYDMDVNGHPANKNVMLRMIPAIGGEPMILVRLFGGQGTINVPSWSPDGKKFAFVSYHLLGK